MHTVQPKAFLVAETVLEFGGMGKALFAMGAKDWQYPVDTTMQSGEVLVEVAGRLCYKAFGTELNKNVTKVREGNKPYIENLLKQHHGSVLEHSSVSFIFVDVSRVLTHELVRHRAGTAISHESGRYVRIDDLGMYEPEVFDDRFLERYAQYGSPYENDTNATWAIRRRDSLRQGMIKLVKQFEEWAVTQAELLGMNNPKMPFHLKKLMTSALRRLAPEGRANNIMVTANHRAWRHILEQRTSDGAEEEIRSVMVDVARQLKERYPNIYQDMTVSAVSATFEHSKV